MCGSSSIRWRRRPSHVSGSADTDRMPAALMPSKMVLLFSYETVIAAYSTTGSLRGQAQTAKDFAVAPWCGRESIDAARSKRPVSFALVPERPRIPTQHLIGPPDSERRFRLLEIVRRRARERHYSDRTIATYV